jgi:hypothetical protein
MTTMIKTFKIEHGPQGNRTLETPRLVISVDGKYKSLWVHEDTILSTVPIDAPDELMWQKALDFSKRMSTMNFQK